MCNFLLVELCDLSTSVFCWLMRKSDSVSHLFTGQKQPVFTISGLLGGLVGVLPPHWSGWIMEWDQEPPSAAASPPHASVSGLWWRMDGGWRRCSALTSSMFLTFTSLSHFSHLNHFLSLCSFASLTFAFVHIQLFEPVWHSSFFWCFCFTKFSTFKLPEGCFSQQTNPLPMPF